MRPGQQTTPAPRCLVVLRQRPQGTRHQSRPLLPRGWGGKRLLPAPCAALGRPPELSRRASPGMFSQLQALLFTSSAAVWLLWALLCWDGLRIPSPPSSSSPFLPPTLLLPLPSPILPSSSLPSSVLLLPLLSAPPSLSSDSIWIHPKG